MKMSDTFDLPVIDVVHHGYSDEQDEAAAHAINCHDELVDALLAIKNDLLDRATSDSDDMKVVACGGSVWVQIQEALAKARGEL